jgi:hypothetical protein
MGKKTAPIVDQTIRKRKVHIKRSSAIDVWHAQSNFRIIPAGNG